MDKKKNTYLYILIVILVVSPLIFLLSKGKISEYLCEKAESASKHDELTLSFDYYKKALKINKKSSDARYGLEDVFNKCLYKRDFITAEGIYNYTYNLAEKGDSVAKMQQAVISYDSEVCANLHTAFGNAYFDANNGGPKNITDLDMSLTDFLNDYDSYFSDSFKNNCFNLDPVLNNNIVVFNNYGSFEKNPELRVAVYSMKTGLEACIYVKDTNIDGKPIYAGVYYPDRKMKYSIDGVIKLVVPEFAEERVINSGWSPSEDNLKNNEYVLFCGYKDADTELTDYYGNHYEVISTGYLPINLIDCVLYNSADNIYYVGKASCGSVSFNKVDYAVFQIERISKKEAEIQKDYFLNNPFEFPQLN